MNYAWQRNPHELLRLAGLPHPTCAVEEARFVAALADMQPAELGTLAMVVGGFLDGISGHAHAVALNYPQVLRELPTPHRVFFRQHQEGAAVRHLVELFAARGQQVLLIGHSWGGDAAVNAVARRTDAPIALLGTLDPVSRKGPPAVTPPSVRYWLNVYVDYRTASWCERSNIIARIGGPWEAVPAAHRNIPSQVIHHDALGLFTGGVEAACLACGRVGERG